VEITPPNFRLIAVQYTMPPARPADDAIDVGELRVGTGIIARHVIDTH